MFLSGDPLGGIWQLLGRALLPLEASESVLLVRVVDPNSIRVAEGSSWRIEAIKCTVKATGTFPTLEDFAYCFIQS